jgi:formyl-CoA transferase
LEEAVGDPDVRHSPAVVEFTDEFGVGHVSVNTPCRFDGATPRAATRAPEVGEHTDEVLASIGVGAAELAELRRTRAVAARDHETAGRRAIVTTGTVTTG